MLDRSSVYYYSLDYLCIDLSYLIEAIALDRCYKPSKGYPLDSIALLNLFKVIALLELLVKLDALELGRLN